MVSFISLRSTIMSIAPFSIRKSLLWKKQIFRVRIRPSFEDEEVDPIIKRLERGDYEFQVLGKGQQ